MYHQCIRTKITLSFFLTHKMSFKMLEGQTCVALHMASRGRMHDIYHSTNGHLDGMETSHIITAVRNSCHHATSCSLCRPMCACLCVCGCVCVREREVIYVCVLERERGVYVCVRDREVYMCVCASCLLQGRSG